MEKAQYIAIIILRLFIGILIVLSVARMNLFLLVMSFFVLFLTFLPAIIGKSFRINLPIEIDFVLTLVLYLHYALGEYNGFYVRFSWWDIFLHTGNSVILGFIGMTFVYILLITSKIKAKPILVATFSIFFAVFIGVIWEIFEFTIDQIFGFNMQKSGLVDTMTDLMMDVVGASLIGVAGFFYIKNPKPNLLHSWALKILKGIRRESKD